MIGLVQWRASRRFFALILALMGSACGGGGGGGSSSSGSSQPQQETPISSAVRISNVTYTPTKFSTIESTTRLSGVAITADVGGDLTRLNGKQIYVIVVDPDGLFESNPSLQLTADGKGNRLELVGKPTAGHTGTFRGNLLVNVCLDAACSQALGNSPMQVPYEITVIPGARFSTNSPLEVTATFGDPVAPASVFGPDLTRTVTIALPPNTSMSTMSTPALPSGERPPFFVSQNLGNNQWQVDFYDAAPGTHEGVIRIEATSLVDGMGAQNSSSDLQVRYVVLPNPAVGSVLFRPTPTAFHGSGHTQTFRLTSADGKQYSSVSRIVYGPGGANANGIQWLSGGAASAQQPGNLVMSLTASYCVGGGFPTCLASGATYQASVYFKTTDGIELSTPLVVTLNAL